MDDSANGTDKDIRGLIDCAMGRRPADLVLVGGRIVNVVSNEIVEGDVGILGDRIVGIGRYEAGATIDLKGRYVCPGFIDAHVHIESSLLSVPEYAQVVVGCGTTAVVADPHEFANVMGAEGISFVLKTAKHAPIDVFVMLSSCVPASPLESAGAELSAEDLEPFLANSWVLGLAEMMNYPGVISAADDVLEK
ncbi:MAG: amidohydrolase family protein, partial [Planctomycetota bacterium]|nr:amidohydrolase family protein [Planctomycetota bacterium]